MHGYGWLLAFIGLGCSGIAEDVGPPEGGGLGQDAGSPVPQNRHYSDASEACSQEKDPCCCVPDPEGRECALPLYCFDGGVE